jgi:hypothetical protein
MFYSKTAGTPEVTKFQDAALQYGIVYFSCTLHLQYISDSYVLVTYTTDLSKYCNLQSFITPTNAQ